MASTALDVEGGARRSASLKETKEIPPGVGSPEDVSVRSIPGSDHTHRTLKSRHIQLIGESPQSSTGSCWVDSPAN